MTEHELQNQIRVALSPRGKVFRTNAGEYWQGTRHWSRELQQWVIANPQRIEGLPAGFPDLLFFDSRGAAFIEVKTKTGRVSEKQAKFIEQMRQDGHRAGIARSVEDAIHIIEEEL